MSAAVTVPEMISIAEVADLLGVSRTVARRILRHAAVPYAKSPEGELYDRDQLLATLALESGR